MLTKTWTAKIPEKKLGIVEDFFFLDFSPNFIDDHHLIISWADAWIINVRAVCLHNAQILFVHVVLTLD